MAAKPAAVTIGGRPWITQPSTTMIAASANKISASAFLLMFGLLNIHYRINISQQVSPTLNKLLKYGVLYKLLISKVNAAGERVIRACAAFNIWDTH